MTTEDAVILDLQRSLDAVRQDRDKYKILVNGLARHIVTEANPTADETTIQESIDWLIGVVEEAYKDTANNYTARILRGK